MSRANEVDGKNVSRILLMNQSELTRIPGLCFKRKYHPLRFTPFGPSSWPRVMAATRRLKNEKP
jgi:hypothetical protein